MLVVATLNLVSQTRTLLGKLTNLRKAVLKIVIDRQRHTKTAGNLRKLANNLFELSIVADLFEQNMALNDTPDVCPAGHLEASIAT